MGRSKHILASNLICPCAVRSHKCSLSFSSTIQIIIEFADKGTRSYSPIQTSLNTFVANCRNLICTCDGSDRSVSTPGAPNIRIVPLVVPIESHAMTSTRPKKRHGGNSPTARILDTGSKAKALTSETQSSVLSVPTSQSCLSRKSVESSARDLPMPLNIVYSGHTIPVSRS